MPYRWYCGNGLQMILLQRRKCFGSLFTFVKKCIPFPRYNFVCLYFEVLLLLKPICKNTEKNIFRGKCFLKNICVPKKDSTFSFKRTILKPGGWFLGIFWETPLCWSSTWFKNGAVSVIIGKIILKTKINKIFLTSW